MYISRNPFILFTLFSLFFAGSCTKKSESTLVDESTPQVVTIKTRVVSHDTVPAPTVIEIDFTKLKKTLAGPGTINPTNQNIHTVGVPVTVEAGVPDLITPGTDTFALPEIVPANGIIVGAKQPRPVASLPARMKDGATYNIQYLDVEQGMNSSYIWDVFEDITGNMWLATDGGGVMKYDGKTFSHFTENEGLASNYVRNIIQDKYGNLWFATIKGISKYDGRTFTNFTTKNGLKNNSVWSLMEDRAGDIWVSSYGGGVSCFNGKTFRHFTTEQGFSNNSAWNILEDKSGNIWFATNGGGVMKYDGMSFQQYSTKEGLIDNIVMKICEDSKGNLWFGTNGGLSKFDGKYFTNYTTEHGLSHNIIRSIFEDFDGTMWLGTYGGGLMKFDPDSASATGGTTFTHFTDKEGISDNHVVSITSDRAGNLWLATYGGGVCKYNPRSFQHYTDKQGLTNFFIWSSVEDTVSGNLWFATNGGGVAKYDGHSFTYYTTDEGLSSNFVRTVFLDHNGVLWFGTYDAGITSFDGKVFTQYRVEDGLSSNTVLGFAEDDSGKLWAATDGGGISVFDPARKNIANYTVKQGLTSNYVRSILKDSKGTIWFGTHAGLCSFDQQSQNFTRYNEAEDISLSTLWSICEDRFGNLWFGTGGYGVIRYGGGVFRYYTEQDGLSNNSVWSICKDEGGNLWMGTERGLNCLSMLDTNQIKFIQLHREDGLKAEDFYLHSALLDSKDRMWWGTGKALSVLDMKSFYFHSDPPRVQLDHVFIREQFVDFRNLQDTSDTVMRKFDLDKISFTNVRAFQNNPSGLELPYSLNHLTFYFSAIEWSAPNAIQYEYQLEGLDQDWSQLTSENKADYRNIPYGEYTFKLRSIGRYGRWSTMDVAYPFIIHPPWWHTWWARTIGALMILGVIYSYMRYRERALQARQKELKSKINEATSEIKHQKNLIEEKHKAITDSINYAERIQRSFLATKDLLDANLGEYFVLYLPKDVVSGDFYWAAKLNDGHFALVTADSTGHGVPGAIMSLLNITSLEKAVEHETDPAKILNHTRLNIIDRLSRDGTKDGGWDGMDCSFISFDFASLKMKVAAANNPVWIVRDGTLIEIKADRFPVGKHEFDDQSFTNRDFELKKGDMIYTMTDGYADQFGGPLGKKFKWKQLQKVLLAHSNQAMPEQKEKIGEVLHNWKSNLEQIDDICLIGIRV